MARGNFRIEEGLELLEANGTGGVHVLRDTGAPLGTSGKTDDAPIGSLYLRQDGEGELYHKITDTSSAADWEAMADKSIYDALGISFDDENMGTYTGSIINDNESAKQNIQQLETYVEGIAGPAVASVDIPAATPTTVSTCLVDSCLAAEWEVVVYEQGSEAVREAFKHYAVHDGTSSADATAFDESTFAKLRIADVNGLTFTTKLTGTGAGQTMGLEISATAAITVKVRRTDITV